MPSVPIPYQYQPQQIRIFMHAVPCWDHMAVSGSLIYMYLQIWWEDLASSGPAFGYYSSAEKTWFPTIRHNEV